MTEVKTRPGDPETRRPGDPETRRPGDPISIFLLHTFSIFGLVKLQIEYTHARGFFAHMRIRQEINADSNKSVVISYLEANSVASAV